MSERTPEEMESNGMGGMGGGMGGDMPAPASSSGMGMGMGSESPAPAAPMAAARPRPAAPATKKAPAKKAAAKKAPKRKAAKKAPKRKAAKKAPRAGRRPQLGRARKGALRKGVAKRRGARKARRTGRRSGDASAGASAGAWPGRLAASRQRRRPHLRRMDFVDRLIDLALEEDLGAAGDVTTQALVPEETRGRAEIWAKEPLVLAGTRAFARVFTRLEPGAEVRFSEGDGARIAGRAVIGSVSAGLRTLLVGERTALNILQRTCGIATLAARAADAVRGSKLRVLDTRKTSPGCAGSPRRRSGRVGRRTIASASSTAC